VATMPRCSCSRICLIWLPWPSNALCSRSCTWRCCGGSTAPETIPQNCFQAFLGFEVKTYIEQPPWTLLLNCGDNARISQEDRSISPVSSSSALSKIVQKVQ
jgi:hypothetical protein